MITLADIEQVFQDWAPRWTAWERDNVGVQVGHRQQKTRRVLLALDVTPSIIEEAKARKADLVISHHPLLFRPPSSVSDSDPVGSLVLALAEQRIALYSAHTNLDSAAGGVSIALAHALGIQNPGFLAPLKDTLVKIAVFVPQDYVGRVSEAMTSAGAGTIGEYDSCSFRVAGKGTFRGSGLSKPFVGEPLRPEEVEETRLEMIAPRDRVNAIVGSMRAVHPYEEVAYDVYPLENPNPNFGMGAIGDLPRSVPVRSFLASLKKALRVESVRMTGSLTQRIRRVAVCGGDGSSLLEDAIRAKADLFVTADVRYHAFHSASGRIVLVDAGHFETEHVVLQVIADRLRKWAALRHDDLAVFLTQNSTNPIHTY